MDLEEFEIATTNKIPRFEEIKIRNLCTFGLSHIAVCT